MGRLTKDVEMRYSQAATPLAIARYGLAVRKPFAKQGEAEADFFNCLAFGKNAEFAEKYFKKGQLVSIVGRLQNNNWEKDGVKHFGTEIVIEEQHFAEKANNQQGQQAQASEQSFTPTTVEEDDDLPF